MKIDTIVALDEGLVAWVTEIKRGRPHARNWMGYESILNRAARIASPLDWREGIGTEGLGNVTRFETALVRYRSVDELSKLNDSRVHHGNVAIRLGSRRSIRAGILVCRAA